MPTPLLRGAAVVIASTELLLGGLSFSFPALALVNVLVLAAGCAFMATSLIGYLFHPGVACRCFGRLSHRAFDAAAMMRSLAIAGLATTVVAITISPTSVRVTGVAHVLLLSAAILLAVATFVAAQTLAAMGVGQLSPAAPAP